MHRRTHTLALAISLAWMALALLAAIVAAHAGALTHAASLVHWLVVGVLPPALAMAALPPEEKRRG